MSLLELTSRLSFLSSEFSDWIPTQDVKAVTRSGQANTAVLLGSSQRGRVRDDLSWLCFFAFSNFQQ